MPSRAARPRSRPSLRRGFSLIEAVMVLLIVATVVGALTPSVIRQISHARVNRAATSVASDFFLAQSMAGRQHFPVLVVFDTTNKTTTITQPPPASTTLISRHYGSDSEYHLITYVASLQSVEVYPNATGNSAITVTLSDGTYTRHVKMSRAGFVRIY